MDWRVLQTQETASNPEDKKPSLWDWSWWRDFVIEFFHALGRVARALLHGVWLGLQIVFSVLGFICDVLAAFDS
jgi:hypothetical protein